jgi:hypothetical protein
MNTLMISDKNMLLMPIAQKNMPKDNVQYLRQISKDRRDNTTMSY